MDPHEDPLEGSDDALPASRSRRRALTLVGLAILALIALSLIVFIASNAKRAEGGGMFGG